MRAITRLGVLVLLLGAGWTAAARLSSANAGSADEAAVRVATVKRTVTVRMTRSSAPAHPRVVTRQVVRYRPTTRVLTVTRTAVVTAQRFVTHTAVLTRTVVDEHTVTQIRPRTVMQTLTQSVTETAPPVTLTETLPPDTVVVTVTVKRR